MTALRMSYTKEDVESLRDSLKSNRSRSLGPDILEDILSTCISRGDLSFGLCEPGSSGSAKVVDILERYQPGSLCALRSDAADLPKILTEGDDAAVSVAEWRLRTSKGPNKTRGFYESETSEAQTGAPASSEAPPGDNRMSGASQEGTERSA